jgi:hypothetical protein
MTPLPEHLRNLREQQTSRRLGVAKVLRETPDATNQELAKVFNVSRNTIAEDRKYLMNVANGEAKTEMQLYRDDQLTRIQQKWDEIEGDQTMSGAEKHLAWSRWMKLEMDLRGTAAPTRSENVNINADAESVSEYRLWVRACAGLDEEQRTDVRRYARSLKRKPVEMIQPPKTSPLWEPKQLENGDATA